MANGNRSVLVVGLGRFGSAVATTLDHMGQDVLAVDRNAELVSRWSSILPTVQADLTDVMAVEQIGITDFTTAVVAIGDSVEASVLVTSNLLDAGISDIWAKSVSLQHARILERIGATHIINAETDAGKRVGHLVSGNYLDYIEIDGPAHGRQDPHPEPPDRLQHRGGPGARTVRGDRGRRQIAEPRPGIRVEGSGHAPQ